MKDNLIPIGKMAAMNRVSVPTLRLYDEKGLLKPRYVRSGNGYTGITYIDPRTPGWI